MPAVSPSFISEQAERNVGVGAENGIAEYRQVVGQLQAFRKREEPAWRESNLGEWLSAETTRIYEMIKIDLTGCVICVHLRENNSSPNMDNQETRRSPRQARMAECYQARGPGLECLPGRIFKTAVVDAAVRSERENHIVPFEGSHRPTETRQTPIPVPSTSLLISCLRCKRSA